MTRVSSRNRIVLAVLAAGLLAVLGYFLVHQPLTRQLAELELELDRQRSLLEYSREAARQVPLLEAEVAELRVTGAALERDMPVTLRGAELLQYLDEAQRSTGVRVMWLEFRPGEPVQPYVRYPVDFVVEGTYPAQTSFLALVEKMARLAVVERVVLEPAANVAGRVEASYTLYLYVDERRLPTSKDLEELEFRGEPGRANPFLPAPR